VEPTGGSQEVSPHQPPLKAKSNKPTERKKHVNLLFLANMTIFLCALMAGSAASARAADVSHDKIQKLAEDAYLYGLQQVIFYETRFNYTQNRGSNVYEGINRWNVMNGGNPIDTTFGSTDLSLGCSMGAGKLGISRRSNRNET